jgi:hypothetical protein
MLITGVREKYTRGFIFFYTTVSLSCDCSWSLRLDSFNLLKNSASNYLAQTLLLHVNVL